jgi:hypothetical protein
MTQQNESLSQEVAKLTTAYADFMNQHKKQVKQLYSQLIKVADTEQATLLLTQLLQDAEPGVLDQGMVKYAVSKKIPLKSLASFRNMLSIRSRREQISVNSSEWFINNKIYGYKFIDQLKIQRPQIICAKAKATELEFTEHSVIKPNNGSASRGVYIVTKNSQYFDVRLGQAFAGEENLKQKMQDDLKSKRVAKDSWQVEQLIADLSEDNSTITPATDLKFYCFYGKVGMVLEADRSSGSKYCEWLPDGQKAHTGRYPNNKFSGKGFTAQELELAKQISLEIPSVFMRIDFLKTNKGIVFGEFTPRPGKYDEFNDEFDQYMGDMYLEAEARLMKDLVNAKDFTIFNSVKNTKK